MSPARTTSRSGFQDSFGPVHVYTDRQADLVQNYQNSRPQHGDGVHHAEHTVSHVNYDLGYYIAGFLDDQAADAEPGLRVDNFNSMIEDTAMPAGRFVPARFFAERRERAELEQRHRAAVQRGLRPVRRRPDGAEGELAASTTSRSTGGFADTYAPGVQNETRNWFDCAINAAGTACSGVALPTNGDGIAQNNEIGPSRHASFGLAVAIATSIRTSSAQGNCEITASVSHQFTSRVSVTAGYYHRTYQDLAVDRPDADHDGRLHVVHLADAGIASPSLAGGIDGTLIGILDPNELITVYNLNAAKRVGLSAPRVSTGTSDDQSIYNGFDVSFKARLPAAARSFGSWTTEQNMSVFCASDDNPNGPPVADLYTGRRRSPTAGGSAISGTSTSRSRTSSSSRATIRCRSASMSARCCRATRAARGRSRGSRRPACSRADGPTRRRSFSPSRDRCYYPRYNQLDLNFKKNFRAGGKTLQRPDRLLQRAERQRDLRAQQRHRQLARPGEDDPAGPDDAAGVPDEVLRKEGEICRTGTCHVACFSPALRVPQQSRA